MIRSPRKSALLFAQKLHHSYLHEHDHTKIKLHGKSAECQQALFLGTNGTNAAFMEELLHLAIEGNTDFRKSYYPNDPDYVDAEMQESKAFQDTMDLMRSEYIKLLTQLKKSGTFYSMRNIGHMLWDPTIPGMLGYFAALLYNQNNVAAEASPVTTLLEMNVGNDLCKMFGYKVKPITTTAGNEQQHMEAITAWGHITCDGSVANLEALWAARNLKFYPVSIKAALLNQPQLAKAKNFKVKLLNGSLALLTELDNWTLLNLKGDDILTMPKDIASLCGIDEITFGHLVMNYTVQNIGYHDAFSRYLPDITHTPVAMGPATKHYSWPKGAAILGIGANNMWAVLVDEKARMDVQDLRLKLDHCLSTQTPVLMVVAVIGSTEESAVDPLKQVILLREEYRSKGLEFLIHADAAWGGYFATMLNDSRAATETSFAHIHEAASTSLPMSEYVKSQYKALQHADSITVDPHKAGYVPYPAGALCYRNSAMRNIVSFTAPVVYHGGVDPTVGVYGVEGSKPGAAAAAVYFSHKVIRPDASGYGRILGECMYNAKRLYAALVCLNLIEKLPFFVVPLIPIPAEQKEGSPEQIHWQYKFIRDHIVNRSTTELLHDPEAYALFKELGGDQTIITYLFNFYNNDGTINTDTHQLNIFNNAIYKCFSFDPGEKDINKTELVVTASEFEPAVYGSNFMNSLRQRAGVKGNDDQPINFIISTIMNPWLDNTVNGSFIPEIIEIITRNVTRLAEDVKNGKL